MVGARTDAELAAAGQAAVRNCTFLLEDALLLYQHSRCPRAHAIATLALEEFGKYMICLAAHSRPSHGGFWTAVAKASRSQDTKVRVARNLVEGLRDYDDQYFRDAERDPQVRFNSFKSIALRDHETKLRGLYVAFDDRGGVVGPEAVDCAEAWELIRD